MNDQVKPIEIKTIDQLTQIFDSLIQGVRVSALWILRQATTDMIRNDAAKAALQRLNDVPIIEGPGRVSVNHYNGMPFSFVNIVHLETTRQTLSARIKRIEVRDIAR